MQKMWFLIFLGMAMQSTSSFSADSTQFVGIKKDFSDKAKLVPSQASSKKQNSWSCGPNSLARFFYLAGIDAGYVNEKKYEILVEDCPPSCGQPTTKIGYGACGSFALLSSGFFYGAEGYADIVCGLVSGACAFAPFAIEAINNAAGVGKVGPTPRWLASYGNSLLKNYLPGHRIKLGFYEDQDELIGRIKKELREEKPVLVLIQYGALGWHYVNIIGYQKGQFAFLDTNGLVGWYFEDELISIMDFEQTLALKTIKKLLANVGYYLGVDIGRFSLLYLEKIHGDT